MNLKELNDKELAYSLEIMADSLMYGKNWEEGKRKILALYMYEIIGILTDRGQRTEDRGQRTEDRGQRTEDRGQRTEHKNK